MQYSLLKGLEEPDRTRTVRNLKALRDQLTRELPAKDAEDNFLLATWNIRDFGKTAAEGKIPRRGYGVRLPETHFYIAEVLSRFDFVAVQEVNELDEWERVMRILGHHWDFIATDVSDPRLGGNGERLTFLYDRRKVWFRNVAGEIVLPPGKLVTANAEPKAGDEGVTDEVAGRPLTRQFARTPYVASFQSHWFKFDICTVHIYYGEAHGQKLEERIAEIREIASYFGARATVSLQENTALILLGDFNIVDPEHETMEALLESGFEVPGPLSREASNIDRSKHYDQIAFQTKPGVLDYLETQGAAKQAGVFEIFENVMTEAQFPEYEAAAAATPTGKKADAAHEYVLDWRTYQFSDHNPMWVRLQANASGPYLDALLAQPLS